MKLIVLFPDSLPVNRITLPSDNGLFGCDPRVVPAFSYFSASPPVKNVDPESVDMPTALIPPARTLIPVLAVTIPIESILVTSSYVRTPVNVAATPVMFLTVISGVPVNPCALVAVVAVVALVAEVALPLNAPLNVVAVATPVTTTPSGNVGEILLFFPLN